MKIFDFECGSCGIVYEAFVKTDTEVACKNCGSTENQKKRLGIARVWAPSEFTPKSQSDLANYLGNGQYFPGYKPGLK